MVNLPFERHCSIWSCCFAEITFQQNVGQYFFEQSTLSFKQFNGVFPDSQDQIVEAILCRMRLITLLFAFEPMHDPRHG
jgi:hypothetical protein